jgi:Cu/Ag efflux protein CusF
MINRRNFQEKPMKYTLMTTMIAAMLAAPAYAQQTAADHAAHHPAAAPAATALSEGEVRKVDLDAKKITLRHGPIANLGMPPMTMVFQVKEPAMLDQFKAGDKVRFRAEQINGAYTVMQIEPAK